MSRVSPTLSAWQRMSKWFCGKWMFSELLCLKAPYFASIRPRFQALRPGYCEVHMKKRRAVLNHFGTVHAIAMCNMAELTGGTVVDATIPVTHRWIPRGMTVEYLKKAVTNLRAMAELEPIPSLEGTVDLPATVNVVNTGDQTVFRAVITMRVSPIKG